MSTQYHILNTKMFSSQSSGGCRVVSYIERIVMTLCPNDTTLLPSSIWTFSKLSL